MKVLVTGATGFVGRSLVPRLRNAGHDVVSASRTSAPNALVWDFEGPPAALPEGIEAIVHLAQSRAFRKFPDDARSMFATNVAATHALLNAAAAAGVKCFCLVSSGTVYEPFTGPMNEDAPLSPVGFLGASKLAAEIVSRPYSKHCALSVLRLFAPYGPGQTDRLIPNLVNRIRNGVPVDVTADGQGMRMALTHVEDVCDIITKGLDDGWTGTINVASREALSVGEIARLLASAMKRDVTFNTNQAAAPQVVPDLSKLSALYDLSSMRRFEATIDSIVAGA